MNGHGGSAPSAAGATLTLPSSQATLCVPPPLVKVTESPSDTLGVLGVKVLSGVAVTSGPAAAWPGAAISARTTRHAERRRRTRITGTTRTLAQELRTALAIAFPRRDGDRRHPGGGGGARARPAAGPAAAGGLPRRARP